ncbi:MAG: aspartate aminotransferase family protein [Pseudomonadota bacterium]|nr:aspartate aminotransferase family protein [Pseudomonadota bacterium]
MPDAAQLLVNDLNPYWMPFTPNRQFKASPRMFVKASGMFYTTDDGRDILDGISGMWCVNAGHGRQTIIDAIRKQASQMDYATAFQIGHPLAFELASRLVSILPGDLDNIFFANSGSEAVDTALKISLAYHRAKGEGTRTRFIGRERGYHGVGFGGTAVGGIVNNRKQFGNMLGGVDHLPHTHNLQNNAFSRGQPSWGSVLAEDLERLVALHDSSTIAAVIVEPMAGSTGVLVPPKNYLNRLREICTQYGILLIFDEVITGFGRVGAAFGAEKFGVQPDIITMAKGLTNGAVPMSAVAVKSDIYKTMMTGPSEIIELFHGYTYSAHPLACAAGLATLDVYAKDNLFKRCADLSPYWENAAHSLRTTKNVIDIRNIGLVAGIEIASRKGAIGARAYDCFVQCFNQGLLLRQIGDTVALAPSLIIEKEQIDKIFEILENVLNGLD